MKELADIEAFSFCFTRSKDHSLYDYKLNNKNI